MELCSRHHNSLYFHGIADSEHRKKCESISCDINFKTEEGFYLCDPCPEGKCAPYLGWSGLCVTVQEKQILDTLYRETRGHEWTKVERWGNPNVPHCMFEGIDCNKDGKVVNITLSEMNLQGVIKPKLGR